MGSSPLNSILRFEREGEGGREGEAKVSMGFERPEEARQLEKARLTFLEMGMVRRGEGGRW